MATPPCRRWNGASIAMAHDFVTNPHGRDLLVRALIFRLVAEQLAAEPRRGALLEPYTRVLTNLE